MTSEQRCGTCRWAEPLKGDPRVVLLDCRAPAPTSDRGFGRVLMFLSSGKGCPCYQPALPAQPPEDCPDAD